MTVNAWKTTWMTILTKTKIISFWQKEWLCHWFPVTENKRLSKAMGISDSMMHRFARALHLTKSEKGLKAIKRRQAAHIRRMCEANGWYDHLRQQGPCEAAREGTRKMWQEVREGKREHPFQIMKRDKPRKYKKFLRLKSVQRKEDIKKEVIRMKWGLPRKTKLTNVVMQPYSQSQRSRRYSAMKKGYIIAQDCSEGSGSRYVIYYDNNTSRSQLFERNCIKDGFKIREWEY